MTLSSDNAPDNEGEQTIRQAQMGDVLPVAPLGAALAALVTAVLAILRFLGMGL